MFESLVKKDGNFSKWVTAQQNQEPISVFGTTINEQVAVLSESENFILYVTASQSKAQQVFGALTDARKRCEILSEPFSFALTDEKNSIMEHTLHVLSKAGKELDVLIVTAPVLLNKLTAPNEQNMVLTVGKKVPLTQVVSQLTAWGYERCDWVETKGQFSLRGDILDVFLNTEQNPVRLSFFGDEVEFIKPFDALSQLTNEHKLKEIVLTPFLKFMLSSAGREIMMNRLLEKADDPAQSSSQRKEIARYFADHETSTSSWAMVFEPTFGSRLFEWLPPHSEIIFDEPKQVLDVLNDYFTEKQNEIAQLTKQGSALKEHKSFYFEPSQLFVFPVSAGLVTFGSITTSNRIFTPKKVFSFHCTTLGNYWFNKNLLLYDMTVFAAGGYMQILFAKDYEFAQVLQQKLLSVNINAFLVPTLGQAVSGAVNLITQTRNISLGLPEEKLVVIGTNKLLKNKTDEPQMTQDVGVTVQQLLPKVGDFVVHETHGVGRCVALQTMTMNHVVKEYVVLEYKHGDRLFLPVEHLDTIAKYIGGERAPALNKLGGAEFYQTKQKVKSQLLSTAVDLVKLYAERESAKGIVFPPDDEFQQAFEQDFAYTETPDQQKAIDDAKADMQSGKLMDRLICGDVGYGKTEVALRAIFKAVNAGYQVAFMCPTTILSQQHYNTCLARMQSFGVEVEVLNRFKTGKEQKDILKRVQSGTVQVLCGTHRLLSNDVVFHNLGLLVLDEEQKFGVVAKEKIKMMKSHIDVLTLSATPIPRSLHMALVGIRDISIIETPPPMKLPVITQVLEYHDALLKGAIENELERGGQVLVVFNNIEQIFSFATHVKSLVGNQVKIGVAHGQMPQNKLENEIFNLYNGVTQILISTTLIENGIDLPAANTLFVVNSDMLGLAQLYQLKGRVGRGNVQAFAYFSYDHRRIFNENALKRLQAIAEFTQLGDGYKIAMRDLEIRGAGNVLGVEQSGHLQKVGYAMYMSLLKQAIAEIRGQKVETVYDIKMESDQSANLPNYFVSSTETRMKLYSEIAKISSPQMISQFTQKLEQLYGEVPPEVIALCRIALLKNTVKMIPVKKMSVKTTLWKLEFLPEATSMIQAMVDTSKLPQSGVLINSENSSILTITPVVSFEQAFETLIQLVQTFEKLKSLQNQ